MITYSHNKVMNDINLKYEIYLDEICQSLQLDSTRRKRMESAYKSVTTVLDQSLYFGSKNLLIYAYGSEALGTNTKPYKKDEFDLDNVAVISENSDKLSPAELLTNLFDTLENDLRYKDKIEKKRYCVRINYAGDFHMDIMPCLRPSLITERLLAPDRRNSIFVKRYPKGFTAWFKGLFIKDLTKLSLSEYYKFKIDVKADAEELPETIPYQLSQPIQRAVQLFKRSKDVYFENTSDLAPPSIILTTLAGRFYSDEISITETISGILKRLLAELEIHHHPFILEVYNPADDNLPLSEREKLSNKWNEGIKGEKRYNAFIAYIKWFSNLWSKFINDPSNSDETLKTLFGESPLNSAIEARGKLVNSLNQKGLLGKEHNSNSLSSNPMATSFISIPKNTNHGDVF